MRDQKQIHLQAGSFEGWKWNLIFPVSNKGVINKEFFTFVNPLKAKTRRLDRQWVAYNIPSSIWWGCEVHHDWDNGGVMYLLTPEEHRRRDKR